MAERVDPHLFVQYRDELLHVVRSIGNNLPCPDCARHATQFLGKVDVRGLYSKDQFRRFLCEFHNEVNRRKGYPQFDPLALGDWYADHDFRRCATRFMRAFAASPSHGTLQAGAVLRGPAIAFLRSWIDSHVFLFDSVVAALVPPTINDDFDV